MTIEEKNRAVWAADSDAIALVPAVRFLPPGNWQNLNPGLSGPYIIQAPIAERSTYTHGTNVQKIRIWDPFQFSIVAASYSSAVAVAEQMRVTFNGNIDGVNYFYLQRRFMGRDDQFGVEHVAVEYRIAETLTT